MGLVLAILRLFASENQYDFQEVLDTVWKDLLSYMKPAQVLTEFLKEDIFHSQELEYIQEQKTTSPEKNKAVLLLVKERGYPAYGLLKRCLTKSGQDVLVRFIEAAERKEDLTILRKRLALRFDLINYYGQYESTIPVAPLVEIHDAKLTDFYVRPPMMAHTKSNATGQERQTRVQKQQEEGIQRSPVQTYKELFFNNGKPYKKIYIYADAGMGKTSLSKMLAVTWCQAHMPDSEVADKFDKNDLETMKSFEFLFLIRLRDFSYKRMCFLDDMISCMLTSKLPNASSYSKDFVENLLQEKKSLVIADGLDEWIHPKNSQSLRPELVPHNKDWQGCSVLMTTRPWKLSAAMSNTDRKVVISKLDEDTSKKLISSATEVLNERSTETRQKCPEEFEQIEIVRQLDDIRYVPYILMQVICLWYEGTRIGRSLGEVYSNIVELVLTRWLVKTDDSHKAGECYCNPEGTVLNCMQSNKHCRREMALILKIAKLAFISLFSKVKENTLLFESDFILKYLEEFEIERCLTIGLLTKDEVSSVRFIYFFPHKSIQEFFAGVYITLNWDKQVRQTISSVCKSVSDILEVSGVFVFLSGMKPDVYSSISSDMSDNVGKDPVVKAWRNFEMPIHLGYIAIGEYQSMQIKCFEEMERNKHLQSKIVLEDVLIEDEDNFHILKKIISNNASNMKSLLISIDINEDISDEFSCLKSVSFYHTQNPWSIDNILPASASTLTYLQIEVVDLTDNDVQAMTSLRHLKGLYLGHTSVSRDSLEHILTKINTTKSLNQLGLRYIHCPPITQHDVRVLQLTEHRELQYLELGPGVDIHKLFVNTESISKCRLALKLPHSIIISLFDSFKIGTVLTNLDLVISCSCHGDDCRGFAADFSEHISLEKIRICLPFTELHITPSHLVECEIDIERLSTNSLRSLLTELHKAKKLEVLFLYEITNWPDELAIPDLPQLKTLGLCFSNFDHNFLTLSPGLNNLKELYLRKVIINETVQRELSKLPPDVSVDLADEETLNKFAETIQ